MEKIYIIETTVSFSSGLKWKQRVSKKWYISKDVAEDAIKQSPFLNSCNEWEDTHTKELKWMKYESTILEYNLTSQPPQDER